ncbi:hypothetical protein Ssi03_31270 [Sphaerisporangium siamense]|uniref:Deoxyribonuclease NucA/NucB domain-containing protein n=1 Tax=Sphaerisporangium siamense TaxID=795645 RepID=A0A7W7GC48_9ACTN|nr:NucA/NucB deoxyribonuclease domain-containing protein [Sphaerisporangium siamense]MBB4704182.1 hypothetical protein [Sphaerisporangium siamense]GII85137.1 hypothetical protein Ssi03_31270 [Sphaerisporangium siamense]
MPLLSPRDGRAGVRVTRYLTTLAALAVAVLGLLAPATAAAAAPSPSPSAFLPVSPVSPSVSGRLPDPKEAGERALRQAMRLGDNSYYDADKVPEHGLTAQGRLATLAAFPTEPPQPGTGECMRKPEALRLEGWTHNRLLWCQNVGYRARYGLYDRNGVWTYKGSNQLLFEMVAVGSNTQRAVRVYWRPVAGSVEYKDWSLTDTPSLLQLGVRAECVQQSTGACSTDQGKVTRAWGAWNTTTEWSYWDVQGPARANDSSREKVSAFDWYLITDGTSPGYPLKETPGHTLAQPFRCDSADYFSRFGQPFDRACVFTAVVPHLQYNLSSKKHGAVARHIYDAQLSPDTSYPIENHRKVFPGWWGNPPAHEPLHRVEGSGTIATSNELWKNHACNRTGPYATTGLPPRTPQQAAEGWECDEYPFHATAEGASSGTWDFSVRWVPKTQNASAGGSLISYFFDDRILFVNDPFWVKINP